VEASQEKNENAIIIKDLLREKKKAFHNYHSILRVEAQNWRLKSRSIWLKTRDRNTKFFHKQAQAWIWRNNVKEITTESGEVASSFVRIKEATFYHFKSLYSKPPSQHQEDIIELLKNIPQVIS